MMKISGNLLKNLFKSLRNSSMQRYQNLSGYAITYKETGDPNNVLEKVEYEVSDNLEPGQILLKMIAAPINPADINMIQGKYAIKPKLPAVGGNEGFAEIIKVGPSVSNFKEGSLVIPATAAWGTWKTYAVCSEKDVLEVDGLGTIPLETAATISVNPCTAYRMLKDFEDVVGGTVIQNGANSGVGQAVIQIAKHLKINTINVVRDRPDVDELKSYLTSLGATHVVTESELRSPIMADIAKSIPKPKLALNCVGGKSVAELIRHMVNKGTVVTYGGMSKQPITINTASQIFNDITLKGYWMTRWTSEHSQDERRAMLNGIISIIKKGGLQPPRCRQVKFDDFKDAITKSMEPFVSEKQILVMD